MRSRVTLNICPAHSSVFIRIPSPASVVLHIAFTRTGAFFRVFAQQIFFETWSSFRCQFNKIAQSGVFLFCRWAFLVKSVIEQFNLIAANFSIVISIRVAISISSVGLQPIFTKKQLSLITTQYARWFRTGELLANRTGLVRAIALMKLP